MNSPAASIIHTRCNSQICPENCGDGLWKLTAQNGWITDEALTFEGGNYN